MTGEPGEHETGPIGVSMGSGSTRELQTALKRILSSAHFARAPKLSKFLRYVVDQTLAGRGGELKEYNIGVQVFERGKKFDPRTDPIVRVQAGKLRERLDRYYRHEGSADNTRILLRRGGYAPTFEIRMEDRTPSNSVHRKGPVRRAETPSLAVLPFLNLTDDPGFEYFSDGLSEELIGLVGRIPGLRVIARTSSFAFKGTNAGLERIGKTLRTNLVLEGSVRRRADAIRVTARLNEASTGHQVWARQYDGRLEDVFAVQDEIAGEIADTLRQSIRDAALPQTARRTENLDARLLLLQAWYHWNKNSPESLLKAVGLFEQAAAADPANALAHAGLAFAWTVLSVFGAVPPATALERADEAAKQAIRYGPERAEAWGAAGCVEGVLKWNWSEGERGFLRALELNPNHVTSRHGYALGLLVALGRMEEAIGHMNRVLDLDPLSALVNCDFGATYTYAGRFDDALRQYRATLDLEPHNNRGQMEMGWLLLHMGRVQEGLQLIEQALDRTVAIPAFLGIYALGLALAGRRRESLSALDEIRRTNPEGEFRSNMAPFALDALGLREEALTEFERAYERRDPHLRFLNVDPRAHLLRGEPRFQALVRKMGLDRPIGKTPARNR